MWGDHRSVHEDLVLKLNILRRDCESIDSGPFADGVLPANDAAFNEGKAEDLSAFHDGRVVNAATWSDDAVRTHHNVGSQDRRGVNLG